jgi:hypothetical protein
MSRLAADFDAPLPAPEQRVAGRRGFLKRAGLAAVGAAAAGPVVGAASAAAAGTNPAYTDAPNTFTAPQTVDAQIDALTVRATTISGYPFKVVDKSSNNFLFAAANNAPNGSRYAGQLEFFGTNGLGPNGNAWYMGVDVAVPPFDRDLAIGRVNADASSTDILYLWNNGADKTAQVEFFPAGPSYPPSAGLTVNGPTTSPSDPVLFMLRAHRNHTANVFNVQRLGQAEPTFAINADGDHRWGPGDSTPADVKLVRGSTGGLRVQRSGEGLARLLTLENSHSSTSGDGVQLAFAADGFDVGSIDATFLTGLPSGVMSFKVRTSRTSTTERIRIDANGIGFNGAKPFVPPVYGAATAAATKYGGNEQQMLQRVYNVLRALGFFS